MSDPVAIAGQFIQFYVQNAQSGNVAGVSSLYGDDSVASYDGNLVTGAAAISSNFIACRVSGGVNIRVSGFSSQMTPTGHVMISVDGESNKPAGRFVQVFLLGSTPTGGMYIKADFCRFGPGSAPQQIGSDITGMTMPFLQSYYAAYAQNPRTGVLALYHPAKSQLSMGDSTKAPAAVGQAAIGGLHVGVPPSPGNEEGTQPRMPAGTHEMQTVDSLCIVPPGAPVNGLAPAVLVFVTGNIQLAGESNKLSFSHAFLVVTEGPSTYIANELCNLIYG